MGATLTHTGSTTSSISVSYSFTSQSPSITKVTVFCERVGASTQEPAKTVTFSSTSSYSNSTTFTGLLSNTEYKLYARSYSSSGSQVSQTNIIYPYTSSPTPSDDYGNSTGSAYTVSLPSAGSTRSVYGSIETSGDEDYFRFTTSSGGTYRFYSESSWDTQGYLYSSGGSQLAWDDDNGSGNNFDFEYNLSSSTTYYFKVRGYSSNTGSYTFKIENKGSPDDHGNSTSNATYISLSSSGTGSASGTLETGGDEDYFRIVAPFTGTYEFTTASSLDLYAHLYNSSGSELTSDDDAGEGSNPLFQYSLTSGSTYYVKVRGYSSSVTGSYTLNITAKDDHGNNSSTATTISLPASAGGKVTYSGSLETGGDEDWFKFTTSSTGGGAYKIYSTGNTDTKGYLYSSSLVELAYDDDDDLGGGTNFGFTYTLSANTTYYVKVVGYGSSTTGSYTLNIERDVPPPSGVGTITLGTVTTTSIQIYWNSATGADKYFINYKEESSGTWIDVHAGGYVGTSYTITGLTANKVYDFKVYASNAGGNGDPSYLYGIATDSGLPTTPSNFRVTTTNGDGFALAWNSVANATGYSLEAYHVSTGNLSYQSIGFTGTSKTITGLSQYVAYNLKLWAVNSYGNSNPVWIYGVTTADVTAPTINASGDGVGRVYASWSASDAHSGINSSSPYQVYIGTAGGTTSSLVSIGYTSNLYYTFSSDANGNSFVHNSTYPVRIRVYDNVGNTTYQDLSIKYTIARPSNWTWWTTKSAGQVVQDNIQASEWTSFCTKINQFRTYKNLSLYSFTSVSSGSYFTEAIFAEARNAISAMSPPTSVNALYKENNVWILRATDLNNLRDALNSIP